MNQIVLKKVFRLQKNLASIRETLGLSKEKLAGYLDVGSSTIDKLEWNESVHSLSLKLTQYITIRYLIDYYAKTNCDEKTAQKINEIIDDEIDCNWIDEILENRE